MSRSIIDVPRFLLHASTIDWDIDWRGQSAGSDTAGGEQIVYNAFPRWIGSPTIMLHRSMLGIWRAIRVQAQGRVNCYRMPMVDPVSVRLSGRTWQSDLRAYQQGLYQAPSPTVTCVAAAAAGASTITINETAAREPVRVGAYLSYNDWPFIVTGRSGSGASVTLSVSMLRTAITAGAAISTAATGLFLGASDAMGNPSYDPRDAWTSVDLNLIEWLNR